MARQGDDDWKTTSRMRMFRGEEDGYTNPTLDPSSVSF